MPTLSGTSKGSCSGGYWQWWLLGDGVQVTQVRPAFSLSKINVLYVGLHSDAVEEPL